MAKAIAKIHIHKDQIKTISFPHLSLHKKEIVEKIMLAKQKMITFNILNKRKKVKRD